MYLFNNTVLIGNKNITELIDCKLSYIIGGDLPLGKSIISAEK